MQQGGDYKAVRAAGALGQGRTLQRVLGLADCLAIGLGAMAGEAFGQFVEESGDGHGSWFFSFQAADGEVVQAGLQLAQVIDHGMHAQAVQFQGGVGTQAVALGMSEASQSAGERPHDGPLAARPMVHSPALSPAWS